MLKLRRPSKQIAELLATRLEIDPDEHDAFMQFTEATQPPRPRQAATASAHTISNLHPARSTQFHSLKNGTHCRPTPVVMGCDSTSLSRRRASAGRVNTPGTPPVVARRCLAYSRLTGPPAHSDYWPRWGLRITGSDFGDGVFVSLAPSAIRPRSQMALLKTIGVPEILRATGTNVTQMLYLNTAQ